MHALAPKRLSRILTLFTSVLLLAGCGQGDGPDSIAGTAATPLPPIPPGFCDPINFEILCVPPTIANFNEGFSTIIDNPDRGALNDSEKVAEMVKFRDPDPTKPFGGTKLELAAGIDFANGEAYTVKVWSQRPVPVSFKLEETGNAGGGRTVVVNHSGSGAWEELCFDFTGQTATIPNPPVLALTIIFDATVLGAAATDPDTWTFYYDDIEQVADCGGGGGPGAEPAAAAPTPTADAGNVISLFSDAYTDIAGIDYNPDWGQATVVTQVDIAGNNTLKYAGLDYQGTDFAGNPQNVSAMTSFHLDFWTADSTALNVYLISTDDAEMAYALTVTPNTWVSVDIPLTAFAGVDLANVHQLKFDGNGTIFLDNLYFDAGAAPATEPAVAAPTATADPGNVISLFSDAYTDITPIDYNPNWGQATVVTQVDIAGNNTLKYAGLDYQGTDFSTIPQDVSAMTSFHLDFWTADSTALNVYLISTDAAEIAYALTIMPNTWVSVDIPLTAFAGVDLTSVMQLKFDGNGTIFLDNLYFEAAGAPATEPAAAAPTPTADPGDVISLFSDAYTDIAGIDYNPNWGQATVVTQVDVAGNNTLKYEGLDYQGTDFAGNPQDVSGLETFHLDFWTADSTALSVFLISTDTVEVEHVLTVTPGTWVSVDIPLTAFAGVDLTSVMQLKFVGNGTIWLDNLYFTTGGGGGSGELVTDGGFEAAGSSGLGLQPPWFAFDSGGTVSVSNANNNGGTYSVRLQADASSGAASFPQFKVERLATGLLTGGAPVTISFDAIDVDATGIGKVFVAEFFTERADPPGGATNEILLGGYGLSGSWQTYTFNTNLGADAAGGVSLLFKADCGANPVCTMDVFIDNVSIIVP